MITPEKIDIYFVKPKTENISVDDDINQNIKKQFNNVNFIIADVPYYNLNEVLIDNNKVKLVRFGEIMLIELEYILNQSIHNKNKYTISGASLFVKIRDVNDFDLGEAEYMSNLIELINKKL